MRCYRVICFLFGLAQVVAFGVEECLDAVDPFIGTGGDGHTFPGPCRPFALAQPSPDTGNGSWDYCSGYRFGDTSIRRFSQTHLNGTGQAGLGDVGLLPFIGAIPADVAKLSFPFSKTNETACIGHYVVVSDTGIRVDIAAGRRIARYRIAFPKDAPNARVLFDFPYGLYRSVEYLPLLTTSCRVECVSRRLLRGHNHSEVFAPRDIFYVVSLSEDAEDIEICSPENEGKGPVYVATFRPGVVLEVTVALSATSSEGAERNLSAEGRQSLDSLVAETRKEWRTILDRINLPADAVERRKVSTAIYHLCIQPNDISDVGARPRYSTFSLWDTFRDAHPLYEQIAPGRVGNFIDSLIVHYRTHGYLPQWELWGRETGCMIGSHAVPVVVDACEHGIGGFDPNEAFAAVRATLRRSDRPGMGVVYARRTDWKILDCYGYYPFDLVQRESVSRTLECCYDAARAATLAARMGQPEDAAFFERRSWAFTNLYDRSTYCFRPKDSRGRWLADFNPVANSSHFTEGTPLQWSWYVPHRPAWLVSAMGGRDAFERRLDGFFAGTLYPGRRRGTSRDVTGLIGDYAHGNEHCHHVVDLYRLIGREGKARALERRIGREFYRPTPAGLCGNDDCGQMSAWFLRHCSAATRCEEKEAGGGWRATSE